MFKKKNILIGIGGIIITGLTAVLLYRTGTLTQKQEIAVVLPSIALILFFIGYIFGGFLTGLSFGGIMGATLAIIAAPDSWRGPLALAVLVAFVLFPRLKSAYLKRKFKALDDVTKFELEAEAEKEIEEIQQGLFYNAVYLVKPNNLKADVTYKAMSKGDDILFFRVGGQFHDIDVDIALDEELDIWDVESINGSFVLPKREIQNIIIKNKRRLWTGSIENNGTVSIVTADGATDYIIHEINDYPFVQIFFETVVSCPVEMVLDKKRTQEQQRDSAYEEIDESEKASISRISGVLNVLGYVVGLWLIFYPRPIHLATAIGIIMPIAGMLFYIKNSRFVTLNDHKRQKLPSVTAAIFMPSLGLALLSLIGFNIVYSAKLWIVLASISLIIAILVIIASREIKLQKWLLLIIPAIVFVYIYGTTVIVNSLYDYHKPKLKAVRVVDKTYNDTSKYDTYYIVMESWREEGKAVKATVTEGQYADFEIGDSLIVATFDGLLQIEWYVIYGKADSSQSKFGFGDRGLLGSILS